MKKGRDKSAIFKCKHMFPKVTSAILRDVINLKLLEPAYDQECLKIIQVLDEKEALIGEKYFIEKMFSYKISENQIVYKTCDKSIHSFNNIFIDFLLSLNHKKIEFSKCKNKCDLNKILQMYKEEKSIVLFNDKIYISNMNSLCKTKLKEIKCDDKFLNNILELLFSFPDSGLKAHYNSAINESYFRDILDKKNRDLRCKMYMEHLYTLKRKECIDLCYKELL
jgi:hypothetical protein